MKIMHVKNNKTQKTLALGAIKKKTE
jgi:hypothetical protein